MRVCMLLNFLCRNEMRATEALHYYNSESAPTKTWMRHHYSHFDPNVEDQKAREKYQEQKDRSKKKMKVKDIFG